MVLIRSSELPETWQSVRRRFRLDRETLTSKTSSGIYIYGRYSDKLSGVGWATPMEDWVPDPGAINKGRVVRTGRWKTVRRFKVVPGSFPLIEPRNGNYTNMKFSENYTKFKYTPLNGLDVKITWYGDKEVLRLNISFISPTNVRDSYRQTIKGFKKSEALRFVESAIREYQTTGIIQKFTKPSVIERLVRPKKPRTIRHKNTHLPGAPGKRKSKLHKEKISTGVKRYNLRKRIFETMMKGTRGEIGTNVLAPRKRPILVAGKVVTPPKTEEPKAPKPKKERKAPKKTRTYTRFVLTDKYLERVRALQSKRNGFLEKIKKYGRTTVSDLGNIRIGAYVYDSITPMLIEYNLFASYVAMESYRSAIEKSIPERIQHYYETEREGTWPPYRTPVWPAWKKEHGYVEDLMHMHDGMQPGYTPLKDAVDNVSKHVTVSLAKDGKTVVINGIAEAFANTPHVWFHEYGLGQTQRDFIHIGIEESLSRANTWVFEHTPGKRRAGSTGSNAAKTPVTTTGGGTVSSSTKEVMEYPIGNPPIAPQTVAGGMGGSKPLSIGSTLGQYRFETVYSDQLGKAYRKLMKWLWWFMPPSEYWKYLGMYMTAKGLITGSLLSPESASRFVSAFALGVASSRTKIPLSEKYRRRKFRHTLWS